MPHIIIRIYAYICTCILYSHDVDFYLFYTHGFLVYMFNTQHIYFNRILRISTTYHRVCTIIPGLYFVACMHASILLETASAFAVVTLTYKKQTILLCIFAVYISAAFLTQTVALDDYIVKFEIWVTIRSRWHSRTHTMIYSTAHYILYFIYKLILFSCLPCTISLLVFCSYLLILVLVAVYILTCTCIYAMLSIFRRILLVKSVIVA